MHYTPTAAATRTYTPAEVERILTADLARPDLARTIMLEAREHVPYQRDVNVPAAWWARASTVIAASIGILPEEQEALEDATADEVRDALRMAVL